MPNQSINPETLTGEALAQWYRRSPAEIEKQRQAQAAKHYQDFFYGPGSTSHAAAEASGASPRPAAPPTAGAAQPAGRGSAQTIAYGALRAPAPSDAELAELRRQQAAFADTTRKIDIQNRWFAAPALAAPLAVLGLEGAAAWTARNALPKVEQAILQFSEREPALRVGDNWATRAGRRAHAALEERIDLKPRWEYEPKVRQEGKRPLRPDVGTPQRNPANLEDRYYLELKPNTPSGRAAAARAVKKYSDATKGGKVRPIYYNPKDFM